MKAVRLTLFLALGCALAAGASDFGLILTTSPAITQDGFSGSIGAAPWFSAAIGQTIDIYLSGSVRYSIQPDEDGSFVVEPGRSQISLQPATDTTIEAGRLRYIDPTGLVVAGLFDGIRGETRVSVAQLSGNLSGSLLYTGLLPKDTATIVLSAADAADNLDDSEPFAPARLLAGLNLGLPGLLGPRTALTLAGLAQFDLRSGGDRLHSQYLGARLSLAPAAGISIETVAMLSLVLPTGSDPALSLALGADAAWMPPGPLRDRLFGGLRWGSGVIGPLAPFLPVQALPQGSVFTPKLSGLVTARLGYGTRVQEAFALELSNAWFLRNDDSTYQSDDLDPASASYLLGTEVNLSGLWAPLSDVSVQLGTGFFLPVPGGALLSGTPVSWKFSLTGIFSF